LLFISLIFQRFLHNNQLIGGIPKEVRALVKLSLLGLNNNHFTGNIPKELGELINLQLLHLQHNKFTGEIPTELCSLVHLKELKMNDNHLTGAIPYRFGNLLKLNHLWLNNNQLTGEIPDTLGLITCLTRLKLNDNQLAGDIPNSICAITALKKLWLHNNHLTGPIPADLGNLTGLRELWLNNNQLSGVIPTWIFNPFKFQIVNLEENYFSPTTEIYKLENAFKKFQKVDFVEPNVETEQENPKHKDSNNINSLHRAISQLQAHLQIHQLHHSLHSLDYYLTKRSECPLRVAGLKDFVVRSPQDFSHENSTSVHTVQTNWPSLQHRTTIPSESNRDLWDEVALKMLYITNSMTKPEKRLAKQLFKAEYNFASSHPHWSLVQVFNFFKAKQSSALLPHNCEPDLYAHRTCYYTMEAGHGTLKSYLLAHPVEDLHSGLLIILQILQGVTHIHSVHHCHLDLSLESIIWLVNKRLTIRGYQFVISNLGMVTKSPIHMQPGDNLIIGTSENRSPEVVELVGYPTVDVSANDLWAVGCIMYEIFHHVHPFWKADDPAGLQDRICSGDLPRLGDQWGKGASRLLEMLWNRSHTHRISAITASRICAMLLCDFPFNHELSKDDCATWLNQQKKRLYHTLFPRKDNDSLDVDHFLELHFLSNTTAEELHECVEKFYGIK